MKVEERKEVKRGIRKKITELDGRILDVLYEEWSMVQLPKSAANIASVHPTKLRNWFQNLNITQLQLCASLERLRESGFIKDFQYIDGEPEDDWDFKDWLNVTFEKDFEDKYWSQETKLKQEVRDSGMWAKAAATNNTLHVHIKEPKSSESTHVIFDSNGEVRFDKADLPPEAILSQIESTLTTREGKQIKVVFKFE